jgi:hypothetical protein
MAGVAVFAKNQCRKGGHCWRAQNMISVEISLFNFYPKQFCQNPAVWRKNPITFE